MVTTTSTALQITWKSKQSVVIPVRSIGHSMNDYREVRWSNTRRILVRAGSYYMQL